MPDPGSLFWAILFGAIGLAAFLHGKRNSRPLPILVGLALMAFPYFVSDGLTTFLIGVALCALLYFVRE